MSTDMSNAYQILLQLLRERQIVIQDQTSYSNNDAGYLYALRDKTMKIESWHQEHKACLPGELNHYLIRCHFSKAIDFLLERALAA